METYLIDIKKAYATYIKEMNSIYDELFLNVSYIKENYSTDLADAVLEGFWDTMKKGAHKVGKFIGSGVKKGEELVGKAKELGSRAYDKTANLMNKIGDALNRAKQYILSAPGKIYDYMSELWAQIKSSTSELYQNAKQQGEQALEQAKSTIKETYNKVIASIKGELVKLKDWAIKNWHKFVQYLQAKKTEWLEIAKLLAQRGKEEYTELSNAIKTMFIEIGKGVATGAKWGANAIILSVSLPIYAVYKGGEAGLNALVAVWDSIKKNAPEVYQAFKAGYAQGRTPAAQSTAQPVGENKVLSWEAFEGDLKNPKKESTRVPSFEEYIAEKKDKKEEKEEKNLRNNPQNKPHFSKKWVGIKRKNNQRKKP